MNFINCAYRTENGQGLLVQKAGGSATAPVDDKRRQLLDTAANADQLVLGIRPEHLTLTAERTPDSLWTGSVYTMKPLGPKTIVHLKVGDDTVPTRSVPRPAGRTSARRNTSEWIWRARTCSTARRGR